MVCFLGCIVASFKCPDQFYGVYGCIAANGLSRMLSGVLYLVCNYANGLWQGNNGDSYLQAILTAKTVNWNDGYVQNVRMLVKVWVS